jgi:hypothetical protein
LTAEYYISKYNSIHLLVRWRKQIRKLRAERPNFSSFAAEGDRKMKWRREIDYHGSHSYEADEPSAPVFRLVLAWLASIGRAKLRTRRARPMSPGVLLHDGQHNFTVLGASHSRSSADTPWPHDIKSGFADNDRRVLP